MENEFNILKTYIDDKTKISQIFSKLANYVDSDFNLFIALKIVQTEIRHSNVLAYLLDSNQNHGLQNQFLTKFLSLINPNHFSSASLSSYVIKREEHHMDIIIISEQEKEIIIIENKINSVDYIADENNFGQLAKYKKVIAAKYNDYHSHFVYLTPYGDTPKDAEQTDWQLISYADIYNKLNELNLESVNPKVQNFIADYKEIIRRYIMKDKELENICTQIYNDNKELFDLVMKNKKDYIYAQAEKVITALANSKKISLIKTKNHNYISFTTPDLQNYIATNNLQENSFYYDVEVTYSRIGIYLNFEFTENNKENIKKLANKYLQKLKIKNKINEYQAKAYYANIKVINRDKLELELASDNSYFENWLLGNLNTKLINI